MGLVYLLKGLDVPTFYSTFLLLPGCWWFYMLKNPSPA